MGSRNGIFMFKTPFFKGFHHLSGRTKKSALTRRLESINQIRSEMPGQLPYLFSDIIEPEKIEGARDANGVLKTRRCAYSPATTFMTMLHQVADSGSLRDGARLVEASACGRGNECRVGSSTSTYSDARQRLPLESIEKVHKRVCDKMMPTIELFNGRRVMIVDGSSCQLADTQKNQEWYPQPSKQKKGCGQPVVQLVALLNLTTGALEHVDLSPATAHEGSVFDVELSQHLKEGDILMADRGFSSYLHFAQLKERGVDVIMRMNGSRKWPKGVHGDEAEVEWSRPALSERPEHVSEKEWRALPETITVRYVRHRIHPKGFRPIEIIVVTTLSKSEASAEQIGQAYQHRWEIELCFDNLKTTLGMHFIDVKSPQMAAKMIMTYIIAHNLIRLTMHRAARAVAAVCPNQPEEPLRQSFKGSMDAIKRFCAEMAGASRSAITRLKEALYKAIAFDKVPDRPERIEPRVRKRRPKPFPLMTKSRDYLKSVILNDMRIIPE